MKACMFKVFNISLSAIVIGFSAMFSPTVTAAAVSDPPNIIFILVDDMRWDQLGVSGHPFMKTPNLDRMGAEGAIFKNAFVSTPLCSPSRASFLTGQYPHMHRVINNDTIGMAIKSHKLTTFPQLIRRVGYETAFIGKWHMGDDDTRRPGFDHWISFKGQGHFIDPVVNHNGTRKQHTGYITDMLNDWAVEYIEQKRDRPFLLYLSHKAVHRPFIPADRHSEQYAGEGFIEPASAKDDLSGKPVMTREVAPIDILRVPNATPEPSEPRWGRGESKDAIYLDHCRSLSSVDDGVGMIMESLKSLGQLDNTLIIFTSDNGFLFGEHGEFNNKRVAYEESLRVPMLMRYPRLIKPGSIREQMALNIDIAPTLYELTGVEPHVPIHGKSLVPVLKNNAPLRESFLAEYYREEITPRHAEWQSVRTKEWKYIHYPHLEGMDELYYIKQDSIEMNNIIKHTEYAQTLSHMKKELAQLLASSGGK